MNQAVATTEEDQRLDLALSGVSSAAAQLREAAAGLSGHVFLPEQRVREVVEALRRHSGDPSCARLATEMEILLGDEPSRTNGERKTGEFAVSGR